MYVINIYKIFKKYIFVQQGCLLRCLFKEIISQHKNQRLDVKCSPEKRKKIKEVFNDTICNMTSGFLVLRCTVEFHEIVAAVVGMVSGGRCLLLVLLYVTESQSGDKIMTFSRNNSRFLTNDHI